MRIGIRGFRRIDLMAVAILAVLWAVATYLVNLISADNSMMVSLFLTAFFAAFTALFIRKIGAVTLFCLLGAIMTVPTADLGGLGLNKIPILLIAGFVFDFFLLVLKIELVDIPLGVILGAAFSNASIPWIMMLLISDIPKEIIPAALNFSLTAFVIGIIGGVVAFLAWYNIKGLKPVIRFEYAV